MRITMQRDLAKLGGYFNVAFEASIRHKACDLTYGSAYGDPEGEE